MNNSRTGIRLQRPVASVNLELARRAAKQHGVLTRAQLTEAGLNRNAISYRLRIGRLNRLHRNVYAVGHAAPAPLPRAMAAVLACGPGALLSHRSAAALWGIVAAWRGAVDVTARNTHRHRGVRVHRSATLAARDGTVHFGIPVTTPARTLFDLAGVLDHAALTRAANEARIVCRVRPGDLEARVIHTPTHPASARLRRVIDHQDAPTRSAFEDAFLAFTERYGLPRPAVNQHVAGYEVDMLWRRERLIVELDGRRFHDQDRPFEHDREKDANLLVAGFAVVRITWRRLHHEPEREASRLRALLAARAAV